MNRRIRVDTGFRRIRTQLLFAISLLGALNSAGLAAAELLTSYEPSETGLTVTSPDAGMAITWPVEWGGVLPATAMQRYLFVYGGAK
jgi:hypothetical protein